MKCDRCDNEANVTVKAIINGTEHDFHLCNECMEKLSKGDGNLLLDEDIKDGNFKNLDINDFDWKSLVDKFVPSLDQIIDSYYDYKISKNNFSYDYFSSLKKEACPKCGNSFTNIKSGVFGCPHCYEIDKKLTGEILKAVNNLKKYDGKFPRKQRDFREVAIKIKNLQEELQKSVEIEDFEKAQDLKEKIDELNMKVRN
ncbi:hypothetical protein [Anaerococcus rubeinfantis]|uniref:hypothetical protein n=1 Tax=Anaerococcus rubeinfantis TaxID=1720199 RepID=UPI00073E91FC|nr:hypothetical protein [Anaerococcus rubeinfantis]